MKRLTLILLLLLASSVFAGTMLTDVYPDKGRYDPADTVTLTVALTNTTGSTVTGGTISLSCSTLSTSVTCPSSQSYTLANNASTTLTFVWTAPATDFTGYMVQATAKDGSGTTIDTMSTAVDVSSTWTKYPRYGYVASYDSSVSGNISANITTLTKYHLNAIQFYDWQYKHHIPLCGTTLSPCSSWSDIANRTTLKSNVDGYISAAHASNMVAMNYNLIYGAFADYATDGSGVSATWGLYTTSAHTTQWTVSGWPYPGWATPSLKIFDPSNNSWRSYLLGQEANVFTVFGFDGWHADSVGDWGTMYQYSGAALSISTTFQGFLNYAKTQIGSKYLVFNPVGFVGHTAVAQSNVDALYAEMWEANGQNTYNDLKSAIDTSASEATGSSKSLMTAAYINRTYANGFSSGSPGNFNAPGVLLADAVLFSSGGSHIELGDGTQMLSNEYFPNHNLVMPTALQQKVRSYYDFLVGYESLLRNGQSSTSNSVLATGYTVSTSATAGDVWAITKADASHEIVHLINLTNQTEVAWRDDNATKPAPTTLSNVPVKYYYSHPIASLYAASPDNGGASTSLSFTAGADGGGNYISFTLPTVQYWTVVYANIVGGAQWSGMVAGMVR